MSENSSEQHPQMYYQRTGILSTSTALNRDRADRFMRVADMRRDIVINDGQENISVSAVGSDILALKRTNPFQFDQQVLFRQNPTYTITSDRNAYVVGINDKIIDHQVRSRSIPDGQDYTQTFLNRLNKAVGDATSTVLTWEKLGFREQILSYGQFLWNSGFTTEEIARHGIEPGSILTWFAANISFNFATYFATSNHSHPGIKSSWKEAWLPPLPIDRWARGKIFLAQHRDFIQTKQPDQCS